MWGVVQTLAIPVNFQSWSYWPHWQFFEQNRDAGPLPWISDSSVFSGKLPERLVITSGLRYLPSPLLYDALRWFMQMSVVLYQNTHCCPKHFSPTSPQLIKHLPYLSIHGRTVLFMFLTTRDYRPDHSETTFNLCLERLITILVAVFF